jgi:hypothetical protein
MMKSKSQNNSSSRSPAKRRSVLETAAAVPEDILPSNVAVKNEIAAEKDAKSETTTMETKTNFKELFKRSIKYILEVIAVAITAIVLPTHSCTIPDGGIAALANIKVDIKQMQQINIVNVAVLALISAATFAACLGLG